MKLVAGSIRNPMAIGVAVALLCLFGWLSLRQLPLQLFPDIDRPTISIFTNWRGASPEEVEAELLEHKCVPFADKLLYKDLLQK